MIKRAFQKEVGIYIIFDTFRSYIFIPLDVNYTWVSMFRCIASQNRRVPLQDITLSKSQFLVRRR